MQVHVSTYVTTPDHCNSYTLSDSKDQAFPSDFAHSQEVKCLSCEVLYGALKKIGNAVAESPLTEDERDDMQYAFHLAVQAIKSWKAHQLRSLQQDKARSTALESLDESSVLITRDWAMKWLPQKYWDTQAEWFGKRDISWHVSVVVRKLSGQLKQQIFVHILEESSEDADAVFRVLQHTLRSLKLEHPEIKFAALRQDNTGCYHGVTMLSACRLMATATGIHVKRVDFSDPHGGKGSCDKKAATIILECTEDSELLFNVLLQN